MNTLYCIDTQKFCILAIREPEPDSVSSGFSRSNKWKVNSEEAGAGTRDLDTTYRPLLKFLILSL